MKKPINISEFAKIECNIHSFSHDVNGNPTALFDIIGYKSSSMWPNPDMIILQSKRRRQVSYAGTELAYAKDALSAANISFDGLTFSHCSGSRGEDHVSVTFHIGPVKENQLAKYINSQFEQLVLSGDYLPVLQISDNNGHKTNHINITKEQMTAIKEILIKG